MCEIIGSRVNALCEVITIHSYTYSEGVSKTSQQRGYAKKEKWFSTVVSD